MTPTLSIAQQDDADELYLVMHTVKNALPDPELYYADDLSYIKENISQKGFTVKACGENSHIIGFLIVHFPGEEPDNLAMHLHLPSEECKKAAYMDSIAVLPGYRGMSLQEKLLSFAESDPRLAACPYLLATVSPKNPYSLRNFLKKGYRIICTIQKANGWERYVLSKEHQTLKKHL